MKNSRSFLRAAMTAALLFTAASVASAKDYQVTGPIVEITDTKIIVQKNDEKWEIQKDKDTKSDANLKVGDKVTIKYSMTATTITKK